jgi:Integrase zinc binding domain
VVNHSLVYREAEINHNGIMVKQLLIPRCLRQSVLEQCHTGMCGEHLGIWKTMEQVRRRAFWFGWRGDVRRFCRRCINCRSYHRGKLPRTAALQPIVAGAPFERLCIDLTGEHTRSSRGSVYLRVKPKSYKVGDAVYYFNSRRYRGLQEKWQKKFTGPFRVLKVLGPVNILIQRSPRTRPFAVHIDKIKLADSIGATEDDIQKNNVSVVAANDTCEQQRAVKSKEDYMCDPVSENEQFDYENQQYNPYGLGSVPIQRPRRNIRRPRRFED